MTRPALATTSEIEAALLRLPDWQVTDGRLHRRFVFKDFDQAFAFMQQAAEHARALDHHPEWTNAYKRVDVWLVTHSPPGLTALDFELARAMDAEALTLR